MGDNSKRVTLEVELINKNSTTVAQNYVTSIDNFGISDAVLLGGANSGQISIKCRDLTCDVEQPPLKNCMDLTMKLKVKYIFPTLSSVANFYIYQLPEGLGMKKILAHGIRMQKNPQTREDIRQGVMRGQSPTCTPARKFY